MTFKEIFESVMIGCHHPDLDATLLAEVKKWINQRYQRIWQALKKNDPNVGRGKSTLTTVAIYDTGTVTVNSTTTVVGLGTTFTAGMVGRKFKLDGFAEVYEISAFVLGTQITLNKACNADADSGLSYIIYDDILTLPTDCADVVSIGQWRSHKKLKKKSLREIREKQLVNPIYNNPITIADPEFWAWLTATTIVVYPAPLRVIIMPMDYTIKLTELSADADTPIIPVESHYLLVVGGKADLWEYDDDQRSNINEAEFETGLARLTRNSIHNTDYPRVKPYFRRTS